MSALTLAPLGAAELAELAALHVPWPTRDYAAQTIRYCPAHGPSEPWPCTTARLLATIEGLRAPIHRRTRKDGVLALERRPATEAGRELLKMLRAILAIEAKAERERLLTEITARVASVRFQVPGDIPRWYFEAEGVKAIFSEPAGTPEDPR